MTENELIRGYASRREIEGGMKKLHGGPNRALTPGLAFAGADRTRFNERSRSIHRHASATVTSPATNTKEAEYDGKDRHKLGLRKKSAP